MSKAKFIVRKVLYDWGKITDCNTNEEIKYYSDFVLGKKFITYCQFFVDDTKQWKLIRMVEGLDNSL